MYGSLMTDLVPIHFVFLATTHGLFEQNQLNHLFISILALSKRFSVFTPEMNSVVSSAKIITFVAVEFAMSFTYIKYIRGHSIDPCQSPHLILHF